MKKISIKNKATGEITHGSDLDESEFQKWIDYHVENNSWGKKAFKEVIKNEVQDEQGNIVEPAEYVEHDAEYEIIIEDKTAEVEAEKQKKDKKKKDREDRVSSLKSIDWKNINTVQELKQIVKSLYEEALKDD